MTLPVEISDKIRTFYYNKDLYGLLTYVEELTKGQYSFELENCSLRFNKVDGNGGYIIYIKE